MVEAIAFLSIVLALAGQTPASGQSGGTMDAPPASIALVTTYVDGRKFYDLVSTRPARSWTSNFLRIAGTRPPEVRLPSDVVARQLFSAGNDIRLACDAKLLDFPS